MDGINALMANNQAKINSILRNLDTLSGSLAETGKELKPLIAKLNSLTDSLNEVQIGVLANKLEGNLDELQKTMTAINEAEGSLGLLIKDDSLYRNMNATMAHLDSLVVDLQENPKKYIPNISVFGGGKNK